MDQLAAEDTEVAEYVQTLEEARDTAELPEASGEAIAKEFERYLRRRDPGDYATSEGGDGVPQFRPHPAPPEGPAPEGSPPEDPQDPPAPPPDDGPPPPEDPAP